MIVEAQDPAAYKQLMKEREEAAKSFEELKKRRRLIAAAEDAQDILRKLADIIVVGLKAVPHKRKRFLQIGRNQLTYVEIMCLPS
eukprot:g21228.t1